MLAHRRPLLLASLVLATASVAVPSTATASPAAPAAASKVPAQGCGDGYRLVRKDRSVDPQTGRYYGALRLYRKGGINGVYCLVQGRAAKFRDHEPWLMTASLGREGRTTKVVGGWYTTHTDPLKMHGKGYLCMNYTGLLVVSDGHQVFEVEKSYCPKRPR